MVLRHQHILETLPQELISNFKININRKIIFNVQFQYPTKLSIFEKYFQKYFLFMFCTFVLKMTYFDVGVFGRLIVSQTLTFE